MILHRGALVDIANLTIIVTVAAENNGNSDGASADR